MRFGVYLTCMMLVVVAFSGCLSNDGEEEELHDTPAFHASDLRVTPSEEYPKYCNLSVEVTRVIKAKQELKWSNVYVNISFSDLTVIDVEIDNITRFTGTYSGFNKGYYIKGNGKETDLVEVGDQIIVTSISRKYTGSMEGRIDYCLRDIVHPQGGLVNIRLTSKKFTPVLGLMEIGWIEKRPDVKPPIWDVNIKIAGQSPENVDYLIDRVGVRLESPSRDEPYYLSWNKYVDPENRTVHMYYYRYKETGGRLGSGQNITVISLSEDHASGWIHLFVGPYAFGSLRLPDTFQ